MDLLAALLCSMPGCRWINCDLFLRQKNTVDVSLRFYESIFGKLEGVHGK